MGTSKRKVIITCAVTGAIHTPSMSKYLPVTPKEIADAAIAASEELPFCIFTHGILKQVARLRIQKSLNNFFPK